MAYFKNTAEIQDFIPVAISLDYKAISPFLREVERDYIKPVLGKDLYDDLHTKYQSNASLSEEEQELLLNIRTALAPLAYMLWIPWGQVRIDSSGIRIVTNDQLKTAFQWQIEDLKGSAMRSGFSGIESLYEFLEENKTTFDTWADSEAYTESKELFINTAKDLTAAADIPCTRRTFMMLKPIMKKLEDTVIKNTIGSTLFESIKEEITADDITTDTAGLLDLIRPAVGNLAMASAISKLAVNFDDYGFNILSSSNNEKSKRPAPDASLSKLETKLLNDGNDFLNQLQDKVNESNTDYDDKIDNDPCNGIGFF
jgi:hypothetical protein